MYGITKELRLVRFYVCKCDGCKERGMYECQIEYIDGEWYDSIRIDKLNNDLIFVSESEAKVKDKLFKLSKRFKEKEYLNAYEKLCNELIEIDSAIAGRIKQRSKEYLLEIKGKENNYRMR